jgi:hypothetical protein
MYLLTYEDSGKTFQAFSETNLVQSMMNSCYYNKVSLQEYMMHFSKRMEIQHKVYIRHSNPADFVEDLISAGFVTKTYAN